MEEYRTCVAKSLVGVVKVDIASIDFDKELGLREFDPAITEYLFNLFTALKEEPDPSKHLESTRRSWEHHLEADVEPGELEQLLRNSQITREDLQKSISDGRYPKLRLIHRKLRCLHGRHRLLAASRVLQPGDRWWPVQIHSFEPDGQDPHRWTFRQERSKQFHHETKISDGEIYRAIRYCQIHGRPDLAEKLQLTPYKRSAVNRLLSKESKLRLAPYKRSALNRLVAALDLLLSYPGVWCGFELGNIDRLLDLNCIEPIIHYIEHIHRIWDDITLGKRKVREAVDIQTVLDLQLRAPLVSDADRRFIIDRMDSDSAPLFPTIIDGRLRECIKRKLLDITVIIPTLKTLHENSKVLAIVAKVFKSHLLGKRVQATIYETLRSQWSSTGSFPVEVREGTFQFVNIPNEDREFLAFMQLFLPAYRDFPYLTKCAPRVDPQQEGMDGRVDPAYRFRFLRRAQIQGFTTKKMDAGLKTVPEQTATAVLEDCALWNVYGESLNRRCGRPFTSAFRQFRKRLFLPDLFEARAEASAGPSATFVQQDLVKAFFPEISRLHTQTTQILIGLLAAVDTERHGHQSQSCQNVSSCRLLTPRASSLWSESSASEVETYSRDEPLREETSREETLREETLREETLREERLRGDTLREERLREERLREERLREERLRDERLREERLREERLQEERLREEALRQETLRQERLKEEKLREETLREEALRQETLRQERLREEKLREETLREEALQEETLRDDTLREVTLCENTHTWGDETHTWEASLREDGLLAGEESSPHTVTDYTPPVTVVSTPAPQNPIWNGQDSGELWPNTWAASSLNFFSPANTPMTATTVPLDLTVTEDFVAQQQSGGFQNPCRDLGHQQHSNWQTSVANPEIAGSNFSEVDSDSYHQLHECVARQEYPDFAISLAPSPTQSSDGPLVRDLANGYSSPTDSPHFSFSHDLEYLLSPQATLLGHSPSSCPSILEQHNTDSIEPNHYSFISDGSESYRPFLVLPPVGPESISPIPAWASQTLPAYEFVLYNGMLEIPKMEYDMERYLQCRPGWTMVVTRGRVIKSLRPEYIIERMNKRRPGETFVLIKPSCEDQFHRIHAKSKRASDAGDNKNW